jgi:hypothetical protein
MITPSHETIGDYLQRVHRNLILDYENENNRAGCFSRSLDAAARLIVSGRRPAILLFTDLCFEDDQVVTVNLHPIPFVERAVIWKAHYTCAVEGHVYDPILPNVVRVNRFAVEVFGRPISFTSEFSPEQTEEFLFTIASRL